MPNDNLVNVVNRAMYMGKERELRTVVEKLQVIVEGVEDLTKEQLVASLNAFIAKWQNDAQTYREKAAEYGAQQTN